MKTAPGFSRIAQILLAALLFAALGAAPSRAAQTAKLRPAYLRCEYQVNPLGIDDAQPRLSWIVESAERAQKQTAYQIVVASDPKSLAAGKNAVWDSGKVASDETANIEYAGKPLESQKQYFWKLRVWDKRGAPSPWSEPAMWSMGILNDSEWQAKWIGFDIPITKKQMVQLQLKPFKNQKVYLPSPYLRKEFTAAKSVRRATVYATALGFFELHINGARVGRDFFTPGWTDFKKRVYYLTYDVTPLIRAGNKNAIGAILSDGWYAGNVGGLGQRVYGSQLRLKAQLRIEYADGTSQTVASDDSWCATASGPIREGDMQGGETYDARMEMPGWSAPGFDDKNWKPVAVTENVPALVQAYPGIPVRKTAQVKPLKITSPKPGVYIFHMGQNFSGCARLKVRGKAGDKIVLRFGEMLNPDGSLYTTNLRGARVIDTYILKGGGEEIWEPRFTFHGFQYVEITGYPGKPALDAVTGIVMRSDLRETSAFASSNPMVNKLFSNILWGQRSNYLEVPTDCPQRDERLGWMGDAQIFVRTAAYNMDVAPFFKKWMVDVEDAQRDDGAYTDVSPGVLTSVAAGWGDAGVVCPWTIHKMYGDTRIVKKHYPSMSRWMRFLDKRSPNYLSPSLGSYGDWLNVNDGTDNGLISTAYYGRDTMLMADMADAIGETSDAARDRAAFQRIRKSFRQFYVLNDARVMGESQTGYVLALHLDLLPNSMRKTAVDRFIDRIRKRDWSLSTGFLGGGMLLPTLTEIGRTDVAYRLLTNRKYPSWGYSIDQGATTIWERWNSYTKENGFGDPGMNSFNHYAYGSVGEWMFSVLAGIDTDGPGFKRIVIRPRPGGGFTFARMTYQSIRGEIASGWKYKGADLILETVIPANTVATVHIPADNASAVTESGRPAKSAPGVRFIKMDSGAAVFEVGSGKYSFTSKNGKKIAEALTKPID